MNRSQFKRLTSLIMCPYSDSKKKKEYYDGHSRHCWYNNGQDTSDIEQMALRASLSLMADYFTDTYGKHKNQWE